MQSHRITIDLDKMKPIACTRGDFHVMLGYRSERGCLKSFQKISHFQGFNFFQLARLADTHEGNIGVIDIVDRKLQKVGVIDDIQISPDHDSMLIHAEFQPAALNGQHSDSSGAQASDDLTLNRDTNEMQLASAWADRLGLSAEGTIENYLDAVAEEDAPLVRRILLSPDLPARHTLWYRLASLSGRVISVCHAIELEALESGGTRIVGRLTECEYRDLKKIRLGSLAIEHKLGVVGNETIELGSRVSLQNILNLIEDCLAEENLEREICLSADAGALILTLEGYQPSNRELVALRDRDYSMRRVGESSSWKSLFRLAEEESYQMAARLNSCGELQLCLSWKDLS